MNDAAPWTAANTIDRFLGERADAIDWAYIDNLPADDCREMAKECLRRLHEIEGVRAPLGRCARCEGIIWMDATTAPWAPGVMFHIACDRPVVRAVLSILAPAVDAHRVLDYLDLWPRFGRAGRKA